MRVAAASLVLLACTSLGAQADRFEVASVKPNTSGEQRTRGLEMLPGGVVRGTSVSLWMVIQSAYDLRLKQLEYDSPLLNERFDINAKADTALLEAASPDARRHRINAMLRSLLAERFKLAVRRETRTLPVYALVVTKGGHRLKASPADRPCAELSCVRFGGGPASGLRGQSVDLPMLADALNAFLDRPVVDRTAIQGRFDLDLPPWNPGVQPPSGGVADGSEPAPRRRRHRSSPCCRSSSDSAWNQPAAPSRSTSSNASSGRRPIEIPASVLRP